MTQAMPSLANITWERLARPRARSPTPATGPTQPGHDIVFGDRFPTDDGRGRFTPADVLPPAELPDDQYPMVLTTGRQLEHWHTGAMTRRATYLDALEPEAVASLHPTRSAPARRRARRGDPGDRPGAARSSSRRALDRAVPEGMVFIPFCYVEAAANILTNPQLDPFGKIPEYKFCAARVEKAAPAAAE